MTKIKKLKSEKKNTGGIGVGKVVLIILIIAVISVSGFVFVPRLVHTCDNCGKLFLGTGYYPNIITETLSEYTGQREKIICVDCARKDHAIALVAGKSLKDFKRPLFFDKKAENVDKPTE